MPIEFPNFVKPNVLPGYSYTIDGQNLSQIDIAGGDNRVSMNYYQQKVEFQVSFMFESHDTSHFSWQRLKAAWDDWYYNVSAQGAIKFPMELDSGNGLETHQCIIKPGSMSASGDMPWQVSCVIIADKVINDGAGALYEAAQIADGGTIGDFPSFTKPSSSRDYSYQYSSSNLINSLVSGGVNIATINYNTESVRFNVTVIIKTDEQRIAFNDWFHNYSNQGINKFPMPLTTGADLSNNPHGLQDHKCRVVAGSFSATGNDPWVFTFAVDAEKVFAPYDGTLFADAQNPPAPTVVISDISYAGLTVTLSVTSQNATKYYFDWGDGTRTYSDGVIEHTFDDYGSYQTVATVKNKVGTANDYELLLVSDAPPFNPTDWGLVTTPLANSTYPLLIPFSDGYLTIDVLSANGEPDNIAKFSLDGSAWGADIAIPNLGRDSNGSALIAASQSQGDVLYCGGRGSVVYKYDNSTKLFTSYPVNDGAELDGARQFLIKLISGRFITTNATGNPVTYGLSVSDDGMTNWSQTVTSTVSTQPFSRAVQMLNGRVIFITYSKWAFYSDDDGATVNQLPDYLNSGAVGGGVSLQVVGSRVFATFVDGYCSYSDDGLTWIVGERGAGSGELATSSYNVFGELDSFMFATSNGYCSYSTDCINWVQLPRWLVDGQTHTTNTTRNIAGSNDNKVVVAWDGGFAAANPSP